MDYMLKYVYSAILKLKSMKKSNIISNLCFLSTKYMCGDFNRKGDFIKKKCVHLLCLYTDGKNFNPNTIFRIIIGTDVQNLNILLYTLLYFLVNDKCSKVKSLIVLN